MARVRTAKQARLIRHGILLARRKPEELTFEVYRAYCESVMLPQYVFLGGVKLDAPEYEAFERTIRKMMIREALRTKTYVSEEDAWNRK